MTAGLQDVIPDETYIHLLVTSEWPNIATEVILHSLQLFRWHALEATKSGSDLIADSFLENFIIEMLPAG